MAVPRLVPSLVAYRNEANARYPTRDKASDGWIGDTAHQDGPSDHNPDSRGLVHAYDLDEDVDGNPTDSGAELGFLAEHIRTSRDPRVKYVIYEDRIFAGRLGPSPWVWRPYSGPNEHRKHMHLSVLSDDIGENDTSVWFPPLAGRPTPTSEEDDMPYLHASRYTGVSYVDGSGATWISDPATVNELVAQGIQVIRTDANETDARRIVGDRAANTDELLLAAEKGDDAILAAIHATDEAILAAVQAGGGGGSTPVPWPTTGTLEGTVTFTPAADPGQA